MHNWSWLIVPITMFVLFVISQLMKRDEEKQRRRPVVGPRREPAHEEAEDNRSDMQKFLDEVQRMRERNEQKKQETTAPWSVPVVAEPAPEPMYQASRAPRRLQPQRR